MTQVRVSRVIQAPPDIVFRMVSDFENLPNTNPDITKIEFLGDKRSGVGTRIRETRVMNGKEHQTDLEVTEFEANRGMRMVADSHGTIWDTVFRVEPVGGGAELELAMDARGHKLFARIMNRLLKGLFRKGMAKHLDHVKAYCEQQVNS